MSDQGFCSKCGHAYLSDKHIANCFQSTAVDITDRIKTLESQLRAERKESLYWHEEARIALNQLQYADKLVNAIKCVHWTEHQGVVVIKNALMAYEKARKSDV